MRKYEKQNKSTIFNTVQPCVGCANIIPTRFRFTFVDPITVDNIVGFVKQAHGLMPSIGLHQIKKFRFSKREDLRKLCLRSLWHRATHSSDYFSIRFMEKADFDAIIDEFYPAFFITHFNDNNLKLDSFLYYLKKHMTYSASRKVRIDGLAEENTFSIDLRIPYVAYVILINIWLFHPLIVMSFDLLRGVVFSDSKEAEEKSSDIFSIFLGILNDLKWPNEMVYEEALEWVARK